MRLLVLPRQVISVCAVRSIPSLSYDCEMDIMLHSNSTDSPCGLRQHLMSFMLNKTARFCFSTHFLLFFLKPTTAQEQFMAAWYKMLILYSSFKYIWQYSWENVLWTATQMASTQLNGCSILFREIGISANLIAWSFCLICKVHLEITNSCQPKSPPKPLQLRSANWPTSGLLSSNPPLQQLPCSLWMTDVKRVC